MATYTQVSIDAAVRSMLELPIGQRKAARDAIAVTALSQVARLAPGWCRSSGDFEKTLLADAESEGAAFYLEALDAIASGEMTKDVRDWDAYLARVVAFQILAWMNSPTVTGLPGSSNALRRLTRAAHFIGRFVSENSREPTAVELVTVFNAEMNERRSNAGKSGALLKLDEAREALGHNASRPLRRSLV